MLHLDQRDESTLLPRLGSQARHQGATRNLFDSSAHLESIELLALRGHQQRAKG